MKLNVKYYVNIVSIMQLMHSRLYKMVDYAQNIGYSGIQSLPLKHGISGLESVAKYFEDVWSPGLENIWQIDKNRLFDDLLQLFVIFSKGEKRKKILDNYIDVGVIKISHDFEDILKNGDDGKCLVEISPKLFFEKKRTADGRIINRNVVVREYLNFIKKMCSDKKILVADTRHLIDCETLSDSNMKAEDIVEELRYNLAPTIHFQPVVNVNEFIDKTRTIDCNVEHQQEWYNMREIEVMVFIIQTIKDNFSKGLYGDKDTIDIVIEYNPLFAFLSKSKSERLMLDMYHRVSNLCNRYFVD